MQSQNQSNNPFGETIYAYTRTQAIEDGELVDVSKMAKEAGFRVPVAVTRSVWGQYIEWTDNDTDKQTIQDQPGRLWDVLWMLRFAYLSNKSEFLIYTLHIVPRDGHSKKPVLVKLKAILGGGDEGEPVITIMLPHED